jgi:mannose-6-phosphate isomerase-like protein (cupin superfamily)
METIESFIESGILEMYVLGIASAEEIKQVEEMAFMYPELTRKIQEISETLKVYAEAYSTAPNATIKPMILASVDYMKRLKNGEQPSFPPILNDNSTIRDYSEWLNRKDITLPEDFYQIYVKLIGYTPQASTAVVWIQSETPYEVHTDEHEKFLILEGTCDINIDGKIRSLVPGDYLSIPLHAGHTVKVTSSIPCKVILQRVAA